MEKTNSTKKSEKEEREPLPDEDMEDSEACGYESSAEMDLEDTEAEEDR